MTLIDAKQNLFCGVFCCFWKGLPILLRTSKATEVSGVQEEMCNLPTWARDSKWMPVERELARYASLLSRAFGDGVSDFLLRV